MRVMAALLTALVLSACVGAQTGRVSECFKEGFAFAEPANGSDTVTRGSDCAFTPL